MSEDNLPGRAAGKAEDRNVLSGVAERVAQLLRGRT